MKIPYIAMLLVIMVVWGQIVSAEPREPFYASPDQFGEMPEQVKVQLKKLGCRIPQATFFQNKNVIQGEFSKRGQKDWAVLCSIEGKSHIHVVWGGPAACTPELEPRDDAGYIITIPVGGGKTVYHRGIEVVGKKYILEHFEAYGGPKPPTITHDAINDIFFEQGSVVLYCHEGKWMELTGAD